MEFQPTVSCLVGGWWERLVGLVKQLLRKILSKASVNFEDMMTILCDCESTINSRPLTYISNDPNDLMALTPNMFLQEIREVGIPDLDLIDTVDIREKYSHNNKLRDDLRRRFRSEYLGQLRDNKQLTENRVLSVGDLILIGSDDMKRISWPLGRIKTIFTGKDDQPRVYRIKTQDGELNSPIQRLYPLELDYVCTNDYEVNLGHSMKNKIVQIRNKKRSRSESDDSNNYNPKLALNNKNVKNSIIVKNVTDQYVTRSGRKTKTVQKFSY